ncbi:hypothetical protein FHS67_001755 [Aminobacter aminovorans]|uniref:Uncharacterized protein n=1 Tax=Aminobacter aminovorans TaxID=83263 RepID=A0AAC8YRU4_AMIAI|nr:hypothetical protein AA2016_4508 [Aminobacter aminovorans]MBB3705443.1 hypothetical protein [Aminobacter aminovorans]
MVLPDSEEVRDIQAQLKAITERIRSFGAMSEAGILPTGREVTALADQQSSLIARLEELRLDK